jgi:hypothetical protein
MQARHLWLAPVILAAQEAEIRRDCGGQIICKTLSQKQKTKKKKRTGGVVQAVKELA